MLNKGTRMDKTITVTITVAHAITAMFIAGTAFIAAAIPVYLYFRSKFIELHSKLDKILNKNKTNGKDVQP